MSDKTKHPRRRYAAEHKFAKIAALEALGTQESRKEKLRMSDSWMKRVSADTRGFFNKAAARAAKRATA